METLEGWLKFSETPAATEPETPTAAVQIRAVQGRPTMLLEVLPPGLPERMALGSLIDRRLRLLRPLEVVVSRREGQVVLESPDLGEVAWGGNLSLALRDLQRAISELYFSLEADRHRLGPDLQKIREHFQGLIAPRG